jgi:hypothetical protein
MKIGAAYHRMGKAEDAARYLTTRSRRSTRASPGTDDHALPHRVPAGVAGDASARSTSSSASSRVPASADRRPRAPT